MKADWVIGAERPRPRPTDSWHGLSDTTHTHICCLIILPPPPFTHAQSPPANKLLVDTTILDFLWFVIQWGDMESPCDINTHPHTPWCQVALPLVLGDSLCQLMTSKAFYHLADKRGSLNCSHTHTHNHTHVKKRGCINHFFKPSLQIYYRKLLWL